MSVGHIARGLEEAGIATVVVAVSSFKNRMEMMSLPRVLLTNNLLGRVLGKPGSRDAQIHVIRRALSILEQAQANGDLHIMS